jgi:uncharacterized RDD family membrane protein YckC
MTNPPDPNPYAPPRADVGDRSSDDASGDLASRWQRLGASLFDGLPLLVAMIPLIVGMVTSVLSSQTIAGADGTNPLAPFLSAGPLGVVSLVLVSVVLAIQWILLGVRGQTLGKLVAGIRVVRLDGSRASFVHTVVLRYWPFFIVSLVLGNAGNAVTALDSLLVFRRDRRCLHDLIAGTKVVRVVAPAA